MKKFFYLTISLFIFSCGNVDQNKAENLPVQNSDSDDIAFIIDLKVNSDSNEDLNSFVKEITENVINTEDFCLEYAYYVSDDKNSVTLYEK